MSVYPIRYVAERTGLWPFGWSIYGLQGTLRRHVVEGLSKREAQRLSAFANGFFRNGYDIGFDAGHDKAMKKS